jgi:hypothetical protein
MPDVSAPTIKQAAPVAPTNPLLKRKGKAALTIQMPSSGSTKIPGT